MSRTVDQVSRPADLGNERLGRAAEVHEVDSSWIHDKPVRSHAVCILHTVKLSSGQTSPIHVLHRPIAASAHCCAAAYPGADDTDDESDDSINTNFVGTDRRRLLWSATLTEKRTLSLEAREIVQNLHIQGDVTPRKGSQLRGCVKVLPGPGSWPTRGRCCLCSGLTERRAIEDSGHAGGDAEAVPAARRPPCAATNR